MPLIPANQQVARDRVPYSRSKQFYVVPAARHEGRAPFHDAATEPISTRVPADLRSCGKLGVLH